VLVTVFLVALFAVGALSVDVGNAQLQRKKIHEATDAAAMAAVIDWVEDEDATLVDQVGRAYAMTNGMTDVEVLAVEPGYWEDSTKTFVGPLPTLLSLPAGAVPAVRVTGKRTVDTAFARVVGMTHMSPAVESIAVVGRAIAAVGALPWAVCDSFIPTKCDTITLQFKGGGETNACSDSGPLQGNFGQLTLGDSGANVYRDNIENGYQGVLRVGDCVDTEPGVKWGPTRQGIDDRLKGLPPYVCTSSSAPPDNKRLAIIPRVHSLDVSGKKEVCINGFYVVSLDGYKNNDKTVTATFLEVYAGTEVDPSAPATPGDLWAVGLVR